MSACSASRWELTDTYSPTAIDIAPAARPATPATRMAPVDAEDAATPIIRLAVETMASSDPSTAARNHPARPLRCRSPWVRGTAVTVGYSHVTEHPERGRDRRTAREVRRSARADAHDCSPALGAPRTAGSVRQTAM